MEKRSQEEMFDRVEVFVWKPVSGDEQLQEAISRTKIENELQIFVAG